MAFEINKFVADIRKNLYDNFPYESDEVNAIKHKKRPLHIRDIAFGFLPTLAMGNNLYFDIGSDYAEENYPYYHILEDAEVIRKRGRATAGTRGSQAAIENLSARDYGRISFNGKTYSREYRKNVRGERSRISKATYKIIGSNGKVYKINKDANYYKNVHYHYIERTLDRVLPWIAQENGLRMGRTQITSLEEEYGAQQSADRILNIFNSFAEE